MSRAPKQCQVTDLGRRIYCRWINEHLSAVNVVLIQHVGTDFLLTILPLRESLEMCRQQAYINIPGMFRWSGEASGIKSCYSAVFVTMSKCRFHVALASFAVWKIMNVYWTSLQCHWNSTQPWVPQQSEKNLHLPPVQAHFPPSHFTICFESGSGCFTMSACFFQLLRPPSLSGVCPVSEIYPQGSTVKIFL